MADCMIHDICDFNHSVLGISDRALGPWTEDEYKFLTTALIEEMEELHTAFEEQDIVAITDAILDLCYFAIGGLYRAGLTPEQIKACFDVIHTANMTKKSGTNDKRDFGVADAIKPADWQSPEQHMGYILLGI